jgi:WD40 repeat protein
VRLPALSILAFGLAFALSLADDAKPDKPVPRVDAYGDPLPAGALMRLGTNRFRYGSSIYSLAVSSDGKWIATGNSKSSNASVAVWEADTGRQAQLWTNQAHVVRGLAFSPDSKRVAVVNGYGKLLLFDRTSGKELKTFDTSSPERVCFTPDGSILLATDNRDVRRWDLATGRELSGLRGHTDRIFSLDVADDGKTIATCAVDGTARLWDADGRERKRFAVPEKYGLAIALSTGGKRLACGTFEGGIVLWDTATGRQLWRVKTDDHRVASLSFSRDGKMLASGGATLRLWDVASGKQERVVKDAGGVDVVAFLPDGKRVATGGRQARLRQWDAATGKEVGVSEAHDLPPLQASFSPDGKTLAVASGEPFVRLWDLTTGKTHLFGDRDRIVHDVAFAPDGKTLAIAADSRWPSVWDVASGRRLRDFLGGAFSEDPGPRVVFSADGKTLASPTSVYGIRRWDTETGREKPHSFKGDVPLLKGDLLLYLSFALAPDGKTLAMTRNNMDDSGVILWDASTNKVTGKLADRGFPTAFSPDGRLIAVRHDKQVSLVDAATRRELRRVQGDGTLVTCVAFSPDGKTLATAGRDRSVYLWETVTGQRRDRLIGHSDGINLVAFSPDGRRLASGSDDFTVLIWDLMGARPKARLTAKECDALWMALAGNDAAVAYQAVRTLAAAPDEALPLLKRHLEPITPVDAKKVKRLLADLDNDTFEVRERASAALEKMGYAVVGPLRRALKDETASEEVRRRLKDVLDALDGDQLSAPELQAMRAIEVVERIGSKESRELLDRLAGGVEGAPRTDDARAALRRLVRRAARK